MPQLYKPGTATAPTLKEQLAAVLAERDAALAHVAALQLQLDVLQAQLTAVRTNAGDRSRS